MEKIIVYLDDAEHARHWLSLNAAPPEATLAAAASTHWVLVACAPRMTHRISKWVSHRARENWRTKWSDKLFASVVPWLHAKGDHATPVLATGPLAELTEQLMKEHGATRVLDARRPKMDSAPQRPDEARGKPWPISGMVAGMGLVLALAFE